MKQIYPNLFKSPNHCLGIQTLLQIKGMVDGNLLIGYRTVASLPKSNLTKFDPSSDNFKVSYTDIAYSVYYTDMACPEVEQLSLKQFQTRSPVSFCSF